MLEAPESLICLISFSNFPPSVLVLDRNFGKGVASPPEASQVAGLDVIPEH